MAPAAPAFVPPYATPIAGPPSLWHFLRALQTNALQMWSSAAYEEDHIVGSFCGRTRLLINDPETIHHVLVDNPGNYRRSRASVRLLRPLTGRGLLLSEGDDWKLQRRTIAPALAPRVMPLLGRHIAAATEEAIAELRGRAAEPVDLLSFTHLLALDIAGRAMFSTGMLAHGPRMRDKLAEFERYSKPRFLDLLLPLAIMTRGDRQRRRFQTSWMALITEIMRERAVTSTPDAPRDLFDLLVAARDPDTNAGFSSEQIRDQLATLIVAGHRTTALTLFWALYLLASDQVEQSRIAAEVTAIDLGPDGATQALPQLVRTRAVVSETLRLFPPAFTMVREAIAADRCAALTIPRHSFVLIAPWVLHRHRKLWREPDSFDPTRFLPGAPAIPRFAYIPFGAGPRVCVGAQFALTEATLALATLVKSFRITRTDQRPVIPVGIITTRPDHAPLFRLAVRGDS
jgi:cytochrome P450